MYLDGADGLLFGYTEPNRRRKRARKGPGHRHPAAARARQLHADLRRQPDFTEQRAQELNRLMRKAIQEAPEGDGLITGPLTVAARYGAAMLVEHHGLDADEHAEAIAHWLTGTWGEAIHGFDPSTYLAWRRDCVARAGGHPPTVGP
jgi:hypothetical protein